MRKREELNCYVKKRYGMELHDFIKQKVEEESLYDYEIGHILNVSSRYVCKLRKALGIQKSNGFSRRFEDAYGPRAVEMFKKLVEDPDTSLADVGRYFGFSRQYAHEVCKTIYGSPYNKLLKKKRMGKRGRRRVFNRGSKMPQPLLEAIEKLKSLGLPVSVDKRQHCYMISANGYTLIFSHVSKPSLIAKRQCFHINNVKDLNEHFDFFLCSCKRERHNTYFIIPRNYMPKTNATLNPDDGLDESKYGRFKEAWNILAQKSDPSEASQ